MKIFILIVFALGYFSTIIVEESNALSNIERQLMDDRVTNSNKDFKSVSKRKTSKQRSGIVVKEQLPERRLMDKKTREIKELVHETIERDLKKEEKKSKVNLKGGKSKKGRKLWFWRRRRRRAARRRRRNRWRRIMAARRRRAALRRARWRRIRAARRRAYLARLARRRAYWRKRREAARRRREARKRKQLAEAARRRKEAERRRRIAAARAAAEARRKRLEAERRERIRKEQERKRLEAERKQKALMDKRARIFKEFVGKDMLKYPILYYKRTEYCNAKCTKQNCSRYKDKYICDFCIRECHNFANSVVSKLSSINRYRKKFFELYMEKMYRCDRRDDDVSALCKKRECRAGYAKSKDCLQCLSEGRKGALLACTVDLGDRTPKDIKYFKMAYNHYRTKSKKCQQCAQDYKGFCSLKCKTNKTCKKHCEKPAQAACRSACLGPKTIYYRNKFNKVVEKLLGEREETCNACNPMCQIEKKGNCYTGDKTCSIEFKKICHHKCKMSYCKKFRDQYHKALQNAHLSKEYFITKTQHEFQRLKSKQGKRIEYDTQRIHKMDDLVFRYNRDTIFDSVLLMEGILYDEQRKRAKEIVEQREEDEQEIMDQIQVAYTNQVAYNDAEQEYRVFEV